MPSLPHAKAEPHGGGPGKRASLAILLFCEICAMSVWFASASAVASISRTVVLTSLQEALLTSSVQAGFVAGTLASALLSLADRHDPRRLFMVSALVAAAATLLLVFCPPAGVQVYALRFLTGMCMAGVYPVGMRLAATWAQRDLGLLIGLLVGALSLGSASPHLLAAFGGVDWRAIYAVAAALAAVAGVAINFSRVGPAMARAARLDAGKMALAWRARPLRLANLGYLGHMWELYAMWAWLAVFLQQSFAQRGLDGAPRYAEALTFLAIAAGGVGAWLGGSLADRYGRTAVTIVAMASSAACALAIGWTLGGPIWLVAGLAVVWGVTAIADSAQFSAGIAELGAPDAVGTLLTVQTCAGFLLTLASIHLVPPVQALLGWPGAFGMLAIGPLLGCVAMARLRADPAARRMAHGKR
jgi:MFS family permease